MAARVPPGTYTALVTPFLDTPDRSIDWAAFEALVERQIAGGITALVPCGTTGESPALDYEEQGELVARTVQIANGRASVFAGTGSASTKTACELSRRAVAKGADGVMVVVPYYNKPSQAGLLAHFTEVAAAVTCPVIVYNIPGRTGIDLSVDTLARLLAASPNVVAVKEATGNVLRAQELVAKFGDRVTVLSGDDALTLGITACGGQGVISVTSNVLPKQVSTATRLGLEGDFRAARAAHQALLPVHEVMFIEANPGPAKAALATQGFMKSVVRGPLATVSDASAEKIQAVLRAYLETHS